MRFQTRPLATGRPSLRDEIRRAPVRVRAVPPRDAARLIDLTREAMVTRSRDLDVFVHADRNDARTIDCGDGLRFVCFGAIPERRLMLESVYGYLTLKNGVPIGYVLTSALFGSAAVAYNVFDTFRGAESAHVYGRVLASTRHLFGADTFCVDPYQLGHGNQEGLESGAWWFYYKLGFRPHDPRVLRRVDAELARMKKNPRHRSSVATLEELTSENMYFHLGNPRHDVLGDVSAGNVGLAVSRYLAGRFGSDREAGLRECSREAADLLGVGVRTLRGFSPGERLWWKRWSPLVRILPGVERWSVAHRRGLVSVIRAKGGRRESDFVRRFDRHRPLRRAILRLASDES